MFYSTSATHPTPQIPTQEHKSVWHFCFCNSIWT